MRRVLLPKRDIAGVLILFVAAGLFFVTTAVVADSGNGSNLEFTTPFQFTPFTEELPIAPTAEESAPFTPQCSMHLPEGLKLKPPKFYQVTMRETTVQIIPDVDTRMWDYDAHPGATFKVKHNEPAIVRFHNDLNATTIVHNHGAHVAADSDGSASTTPQKLIPPGEFRDFCYPNIAPIDPVTGEQDMSDFNSTQWYHDHAHLPDTDIGITGQNTYMGLQGFYLLRDELEQSLIDNNVLPADPFDIPLGFADRVLAPDGSLLFHEDDFNGFLGDVFMVNGKAQPVLHVQRRKYRFRMLVGSQARWWEFRLSTGQPLLQIGNDSALLGKAVIPISYGVDAEPRVGTVRLSVAERADVIIDFSNAPDEFFLENILTMREDGRGPDKITIPGTPIIKFVVEGPPVEGDATVVEGTPLRPHIPIPEGEVVATRVFEFQRQGGEWAINSEFFNAHKDNAQPLPNSVERWILRNGGGGWSHPIHIHLGNFNIKSYKTHPVPPQDQFKKDTVQLLPGEEVEIIDRFSTFTGRYVFHCHNITHEDHAMMGVFNIGAVPVDFSNVKPGTPGNIPAVQPDKGEPVPPPLPPGASPTEVGTVQIPLVFEPGEHANEPVPPGPFVPEIPADANPPEFGPPPGPNG